MKILEKGNKSSIIIFLHGGVVLSLDVLPQEFQLVKREHGQNTANDGQSLDVVLLGIGSLLEVPGDGAQSIEDVPVQSGHGHGALVVGVDQVGLSRAAIINYSN